MPPPRFRGRSAAKPPPEAELLACVVVGLIEPHEREDFDRRFSDDWARRYGHPVLLVESFVDESLFQGT
ncbi:MAG: hypothetical protein ACKOET_18240, partial [Verrucomicrobiota bacterium]